MNGFSAAWTLRQLSTFRSCGNLKAVQFKYPCLIRPSNHGSRARKTTRKRTELFRTKLRDNIEQCNYYSICLSRFGGHHQALLDSFIEYLCNNRARIGPLYENDVEILQQVSLGLTDAKEAIHIFVKYCESAFPPLLHGDQMADIIFRVSDPKNSIQHCKRIVLHNTMATIPPTLRLHEKADPTSATLTNCLLDPERQSLVSGNEAIFIEPPVPIGSGHVDRSFVSTLMRYEGETLHVVGDAGIRDVVAETCRVCGIAFSSTSGHFHEEEQEHPDLNTGDVLICKSTGEVELAMEFLRIKEVKFILVTHYMSSQLIFAQIRLFKDEVQRGIRTCVLVSDFHISPLLMDRVQHRYLAWNQSNENSMPITFKPSSPKIKHAHFMPQTNHIEQFASFYPPDNLNVALRVFCDSIELPEPLKLPNASSMLTLAEIIDKFDLQLSKKIQLSVDLPSFCPVTKHLTDFLRRSLKVVSAGKELKPVKLRRHLGFPLSDPKTMDGFHSLCTRYKLISVYRYLTELFPNVSTGGGELEKFEEEFREVISDFLVRLTCPEEESQLHIDEGNSCEQKDPVMPVFEVAVSRGVAEVEPATMAPQFVAPRPRRKPLCPNEWAPQEEPPPVIHSRSVVHSLWPVLEHFSSLDIDLSERTLCLLDQEKEWTQEIINFISSRESPIFLHEDLKVDTSRPEKPRQRADGKYSGDDRNLTLNIKDSSLRSSSAAVMVALREIDQHEHKNKILPFDCPIPVQAGPEATRFLNYKSGDKLAVTTRSHDLMLGENSCSTGGKALDSASGAFSLPSRVHKPDTRLFSEHFSGDSPTGASREE